MERKKYTPELVDDRLNEYYKTGIESLFDDGLQWQEKVLQDIIELGNQSEYAKDKGFLEFIRKKSFLKKFLYPIIKIICLILWQICEVIAIKFRH